MKRIVFLGIVFFLVLVLGSLGSCEGSCEASGVTGVTKEEALYLADVFFDEVKKTGFLPEFVEVVGIEIQVKEFQGYGLWTQTLVATAYVRWQDGDRKGTFSVSETLRLATGGDRVKRGPLTLEEHVKIIKRIAKEFGDLKL